MTDTASQDRAISPVIGLVLLVAVVVGLSAVSAGMFYSLNQERDPAPAVTMSLEPTDVAAVQQLSVEQGPTLEGENIEIRGGEELADLAPRELAAGDQHRIVPTATTVEVVWYGSHDTSYVIWEESVSQEATAPTPDEGCSWVETESDGGTENVKVIGEVVACDVETSEGIEVQDGGVIIGETTSGAKDIDADDATFYGDVEVETVFNLQDGLVAGSVQSHTADIKLDNGTATGSVSAVKVLEVVNESSVGGDATSDDQVKVLSSEVAASVVSDDSVKLQDATVEGEVYVDAASFDCTNSTINGQDCASYSPRDPETY